MAGLLKYFRRDPKKILALPVPKGSLNDNVSSSSIELNKA